MFNTTIYPQVEVWNPFSSSQGELYPGIYQVVKQRGQWTLDYKYSKFDLPSKIYGKLPKISEHIWKAFQNNDSSIGVLLTGLKGSGKTELAKLLSNKAIDNGYAVIMFININPDAKLIEFISSLKNVVLFMDEFGKVFNLNIQDKLLTAMSDIKKSKKLYIMTENNKYSISGFILDRPSRARYHLDFKRLPEDIVLEYCKDHNVDKKFMDELLNRYKSAKNFTFDHLKAIVDEHNFNKELEFDDVVELLNVSLVKEEKMFIINNILSNTLDNDRYIYDPKPRLLNGELIEDGYLPSLSINIYDKETKKLTFNTIRSGDLSSAELTIIDENHLNIERDGWFIEIKRLPVKEANVLEKTLATELNKKLKESGIENNLQNNNNIPNNNFLY